MRWEGLFYSSAERIQTLNWHRTSIPLGILKTGRGRRPQRRRFSTVILVRARRNLRSRPTLLFKAPSSGNRGNGTKGREGRREGGKEGGRPKGGRATWENAVRTRQLTGMNRSSGPRESCPIGRRGIPAKVQMKLHLRDTRYAHWRLTPATD